MSLLLALISPVAQAQEKCSPMIVVCIGDSITAGGMSTSHCPGDTCDQRDAMFIKGEEDVRGGALSYPAQLAVMLSRDDSSDKGIATPEELDALYAHSSTVGDDYAMFSVDPTKLIVYNYGRNAATVTNVDSNDNSQYWKAVIPSLPRWDAAIVTLGTYDAAEASLTDAEFDAELEILVNELRRMNEGEVFLGITPPIAEESHPDYERIMGSALAGVGIPDYIVSLAKDYHAKLVDFKSALSTEMLVADPKSFSADGFHPNWNGYTRMAEAASVALSQSACMVNKGKTQAEIDQDSVLLEGSAEKSRVLRARRLMFPGSYSYSY